MMMMVVVLKIWENDNDGDDNGDDGDKNEDYLSNVETIPGGGKMPWVMDTNMDPQLFCLR